MARTPKPLGPLARPLKRVGGVTPFDTHEVAWAAGFFDGEGSTMFTPRYDGRQPRIRIGIGQSSDNVEVLLRFRRAIGGLGNIEKPRVMRGAKTPVTYYSLYSFEAVQATIARLWKYLGSEKRAQAMLVLLTHREAMNGSYA